MSTTKISDIKDTNSEEYYQLIRQIYHQLTNLEKTMKLYSFTESLYFIQLSKQYFEHEIAKEA